MLSRVRFFVYRLMVSLLTWISFLTQKVHALAPPADGAPLRFRPFATAFPEMPIAGLWDAEDFPPSDVAPPRLKSMRGGKLAFRIFRWIAPKTTPPIPSDPKKFLRIVYPFFFRRAWKLQPTLPAALAAEGCDVVAELAVRGPFASYLRRGESDGEYVMDLTWMLPYACKDDCVAPGGKATLEARGGALHTVKIERGGQVARPGTPEFAAARTAFLAGLNEDLTTFRHNVSTHLSTLTAFALASPNRLPANHPVRRLLHHAFHTVLVGNREVAEFQLSGPAGFSSTIFSHDAPVLAAMANDYLQRFDVWDFEPPAQFARRGTAETPFAYPYRENMLHLWRETLDYVDTYLRLYYVDDDAVRGDAALMAWLDDLERLVPNGIRRPPAPAREWLTRLCATLLHLSTAEHDVLNNVVWNYSTIGWVIPTAALRSGAPMDQRRAFDLVATIIGTWKPYNMLLTADVPSLALDDGGRAAMQRWIDRLTAIQQEMAAGGIEAGLTYPANMNPSVSN
jgi:hypothetical protein